MTWRGETECLTVFVEGDVDLVTCADLDSGLAEAERLVTAGSRVVLDLRGVTFLGAAGLRVLVNSQRRCADRGVTFAVLATRRAVTRPIELAGLADQLRLTARS